MKILLQQNGTELFLAEDGAWVPDEAHARVFKNSLAALDYCIENELRDANIALRFPDARFNLRLQAFGRQPPKLAADNPEATPATLQERSEVLRRTGEQLAAKMDSITAEAKERRKKRTRRRGDDAKS